MSDRNIIVNVEGDNAEGGVYGCLMAIGTVLLGGFLFLLATAPHMLWTILGLQ